MVRARASTEMRKASNSQHLVSQNNNDLAAPDVAAGGLRLWPEALTVAKKITVLRFRSTVLRKVEPAVIFDLESVRLE